MLALVADSKKRAQKAELSDAQKNFKLSRAFNLHSALSEKCLLFCTHLQNECNSDDAAIFQNKKYKDLLKLSVEQQFETCAHLVEQYNLNGLLAEMQDLSSKRLEALQLTTSTTAGMFEAYAIELNQVFTKNKT